MRTVAGLLYGALLAFLAVLATGGVHGNFVILFVASAPFGFLGNPAAVFGAPLLWAAVGALVADPISARAVLLVHYASAVALVMVYYRSGHPAQMLGIESGIIPWAVVYLVGQAVVWRRILVK